jgi:hypothetical protein
MHVASRGPLRRPFASLELPLDAYVTPGRGKRVECCLPVVCAADEEEIESLWQASCVNAMCGIYQFLLLECRFQSREQLLQLSLVGRKSILAALMHR